MRRTAPPTRRGAAPRATAGRRRGAARAGAAGQRERPAASTDHGSERLQKMLARCGLASRRAAEAWIRAGRLTVNGVVATLGARVSPADQVRLDGRPVRPQPLTPSSRVFVGHRSPGEPLAAGAPASPAGPAGAGLLARLPRRAGRRFIAVSPMPRVDGGLELVTSDGELAARLQRGVHVLASEFGVRVRGELAAAQLAGILGGVLDSGARLAVEHCQAAGGEGANRWYTLLVRGASGREVRQLFERQGALVSRVLRTRLGPVALERSLGRGRLRELTQEELRALLPADPPAAGG
jgi:23S rRNA pseudouridine2605 synthase